MTTLDDPDAINFEGMFEFIKAPTSCKDGRRKFGPSGTIHMTFGDVSVIYLGLIKRNSIFIIFYFNCTS